MSEISFYDEMKILRDAEVTKIRDKCFDEIKNIIRMSVTRTPLNSSIRILFGDIIRAELKDEIIEHFSQFSVTLDIENATDIGGNVIHKAPRGIIITFKS